MQIGLEGGKYNKLNWPSQNYRRIFKIKWYFLIYVFLIGFFLFTFNHFQTKTTIITIQSDKPDSEITRHLKLGDHEQLDYLSNTITVNNDHSSNVNFNILSKGYKIKSIKTNKRDGTIVALLELINSDIDPTYDFYTSDYQILQLKVEYQTEDRLNIQIRPFNLTDVYIIPDDLLNRPKKSGNFKSSPSLKFTYKKNPFSFTITRKQNNEVLFSTLNNPLIFSNKYIQINTTLPPNHNISGLGELSTKFISDPGSIHTIYSSVNDTIHATHPVYYDQRITGTHAVYWRSSAMQEVIIENTSLTWRSLSGIIDLYIYGGPTPKETITQFVSSIGLPALQPYWALGYHQSRWGYKTLEEVKTVVGNFKTAQIPLETIWCDIDFMHNYKDFTNNEESYPLNQLQYFIQSLHDAGQHFVPIVNTSINYPNFVDDSNLNYYSIYNDGLNNDIYLKNPDGSLYISDLSSGYTVFPDFMATRTKSWWTRTIEKWHENIKFDGVWLGMSESALPSNILELEDIEDSGINKCDIIHRIDNIQDEGVFSTNATHLDGTSDYEVHNLRGYSESKTTYDSLLDIIPNKRPFILSSSTHTGSGQFTAHCHDDNESKWYSMYISIPQALNSGMYGVPFFGVDTCGFDGDSTEELCSRWIQLASFFPFYRNHNSFNSISQEPYIWKKVSEVAKSAIEVRYSLLPYYYTLLHDAHETGIPPMRALSWVFPNDPSLIGLDRQFFIGDALLVTPVLEAGASRTHGVFPGSGVDEVYYEYYTFGKARFKPGVHASIRAPLGYIPLHIRGGSIIPLQDPGYTIIESRKGKFQLLIALRLDGTAEGHAYFDDGESLIINESLKSEFKVANKKLTVESIGQYFDPEQLNKVTILGVAEEPSNVYYHENNWNDHDIENCGFIYENGHLIIEDLDDYTDSGAFVENFTISWS